MANIKELRRILEIVEHVELQPEGTYWDQGTWIRVEAPEEEGETCHTAMCFAGWKAFTDGYNKPVKGGPMDSSDLYLVRADGKRLSEYSISQYAVDALELKDWEADVLFHESNTIEDLRRIIDDIEAGRLLEYDPDDDELELEPSGV